MNPSKNTPQRHRDHRGCTEKPQQNDFLCKAPIARIFLDFKLKLAKVALRSGGIIPRHCLFHLRDLTP